MPWLTPDTPIPVSSLCRRIRIPDGVDWLAIVSGALLSLTNEYNWEQFGTLTPAQVASVFSSVYQDFSTQGDFCMIGSVIAYASVTAPDNTLPCDGSSYTRDAYPELYAVLAAPFIVDADNFITPDLRSRVPMGIDPTGTPAYNTGDIGGEQTHVLTIVELAAHNHTDSGHAHIEGTTTPTAITIGPGTPAPAAIGIAGSTGTGFSSITNSGSDAGHNNMQPYIALPYAIVCR